MTGYAHIYDPDTDFDRHYTACTARRIRPMLKPRQTILELGAATGAMTQALAGEGRRIVAVERAASYVERARARDLPGVDWVQANLRTFTTTERFDHILACNLLHELPQRTATLQRVIPLLRPGGWLHVTLPNPRSLHRLAALGAGMITSLIQPSERAVRLQTIRLCDPDEFVAEMAGLRLNLRLRDAIMVKPLPNQDMARCSDAVIEAWDALAARLPEHGALTRFVFERADA